MRTTPTPRTSTARLAWAFYDWANSAFPTLIETFVFAAYFTREIAQDEVTGQALWGNTLAAAGLIVALTGPLLGATVDRGGQHKPWIGVFTLICVAATAMLWFIEPSSEEVMPALILVAIGSVAVELAVVLYNALLVHITPAERIGRWSGWAWSLGYAGGMTSLIVALLLIKIPIPGLDSETAEPVRLTFVLAAVWYALFALPFFRYTPDTPPSAKPLTRRLREALAQLRDSARTIRRYTFIVRFLIARMVFIDGLATLFAFGGVYAAGAFDMSTEQVLGFGIGLNVTAGLGALLFAWLDDWLGARTVILLALLGLILTASALLLVRSLTWFWVLGLGLGLFVGPAQAAGRSYLARATPTHLINQMFGFFTFSGKATAFVGPLLVGTITTLSGSQRIGMSVIVVLFVLGFLLMLGVPEAARARAQAEAQP